MTNPSLDTIRDLTFENGLKRFPKKCEDCFCAASLYLKAEGTYSGRCIINLKNIELYLMSDGKPTDCPLKEIWQNAINRAYEEEAL